jgi:hypothetical protein
MACLTADVCRGVNVCDYRRAPVEVKRMGLDRDRIKHHPSKRG